MSIKYKPYSELTDKQKMVFINTIIPLARVGIEGYYDDLFEEWEDDWELHFNEFNKLVENKQYEDLYNFIYKYNLM